MIKVLIVEDSKVVSEYLRYILSQDEKIEVIGVVGTGKQAVEFVKHQKPDVITMDIDLPEMNGLEATRHIMATNPVPILVVTASRNAQEVDISIQALASGALAVIEKPVGLTHPKADDLSKKLINMVKVMAEVSVVTRRNKNIVQKPVPIATLVKDQTKNIEFEIPKVVAIGVSSGGPQTLQVIFSKITQSFPAPILVVQHIAPGFIEGLISWLQRVTTIPVSIAHDNELALPGHIYFAPDNFHLGINPQNRLILTSGNNSHGFCPSIASLFSSVTQNFGSDAVGIILTGMGSDGAEELKKLHDTGAITIAQNKESALIFGIPAIAIQLGAATYVLSDEEIGLTLSYLEKKAIHLSEFYSK